MIRITFIIGIMLVGIIALIESSGKHNRRVNYMNGKELEDDVWLGN